MLLIKVTSFVHMHCVCTVVFSNYNYFAIVGAEAVAILSNRVSQINIHTRFTVDESTWPPGKPAHFIPLLLVHKKRRHTSEQVQAMAEIMHAGDIGKVAMVIGGEPAVKYDKLDSHEKFHKKFHKMLDVSKATKEIEEILAPLDENTESSFILIEGAPGIGKSNCLQVG